MKFCLVLSLFCFLTILSSCEYNNEEALFGVKENCNDPLGFTTSGIELLINTNCAISGCHAAGGISPELTSYEKVKGRSDDIKRETQSLHMPPPSSGKTLTQEEIGHIACWLEQGAPN